MVLFTASQRWEILFTYRYIKQETASLPALKIEVTNKNIGCTTGGGKTKLMYCSQYSCMKKYALISVSLDSNRLWKTFCWESNSVSTIWVFCNYTVELKKKTGKKKVAGLDYTEFFKMSQLVKPSNYTSITALCCSND